MPSGAQFPLGIFALCFIKYNYFKFEYSATLVFFNKFNIFYGYRVRIIFY